MNERTGTVVDADLDRVALAIDTFSQAYAAFRELATWTRGGQSIDYENAIVIGGITNHRLVDPADWVADFHLIGNRAIDEALVPQETRDLLRRIFFLRYLQGMSTRGVMKWIGLASKRALEESCQQVELIVGQAMLESEPPLWPIHHKIFMNGYLD